MRTILIIKPSSLGDVIHAFPAFELIRAHCPDTVVDWVINSELAPLLDYLGSPLDRVIPFPRGKMKTIAAVPATLTLTRQLRARRYDAVIDLQGLLRSAFMAKVATAPVKAGFAHPREQGAALFYNERFTPPQELAHAVEKNAYLVSKTLGLAYSVPQPSLPENPVHAAALTGILADKGINGDAPIVAIAPGARWLTKRWAPAFFAEVLDRVHQARGDLQFVIIGSRAEAPLGEELLTACATARPFNLCGATSFPALFELLRRSRLLLCNDSGPMHIAAALGVKVFSLFGPTSPGRTGPYGGSPTLFQHNCSCIECLKRYCYNDNLLECQKGIAASNVSDAIINFLEVRQRPS